jgi:hypothetical protein
MGIYNSEQKQQTIVLVTLALVILIARQIMDHGGVYNAFLALTKGCEYEKPGLWRKGPYPVASRFCGDASDLQGLKNHMRVNCVAMEACTAGEFGSNVAVWYFPLHDILLVNPTIENEQGEMIQCKRPTGGSIHVPSPVTVTFTSEEFQRASRSFRNRGACLVHAMNAETRGDTFL